MGSKVLFYGMVDTAVIFADTLSFHHVFIMVSSRYPHKAAYFNLFLPDITNSKVEIGD